MSSGDEEVGRLLRRVYPYVESDEPEAFFRRTGFLYQAVSFSYLFWPKLFEVYGAVFFALDEGMEEYFSEQFSTPKPLGNKSFSWADMVDSCNWFEISQLVLDWGGSEACVDEAVDVLAEKLRHTWGAKLKIEYPDREFDISYVTDGDGVDAYLQVRQISPKLDDPPGWDSARRCFTQG